MSMDKTSNITKLKYIIGGDKEVISRLAAALWARVGRPLEIKDLSWTQALIGTIGPELVWNSLEELQVLSGTPPQIEIKGLANFILYLVSETEKDNVRNKNDIAARLVWTLPIGHISRSIRGVSYKEAIIELIDQACEQLLVVTPFIDTSAIGSLINHLVSALTRGVKLTIVTHDLLNISSFTSKAIEELRREAELYNGKLFLYSAQAGTGQDRLANPLLHAKLVICDKARLLVGSANFTSYAFSTNLEAGVLLNESAAVEALAIMDGILKSKFVHLYTNATF